MEMSDMRKCQPGQFLLAMRNKKTVMDKKDFDREAYRRNVQTNNLIGILLCLSAIAMIIIILILARVVK